jgi:hypothetical protein
MNCEQAMACLDITTWGELAMQDRAGTAEHLRGCKLCRQLVEEVCQLEQIFAGVGEPRPSEQLVLDVVAQARPLLAHRRESRSQPSGGWRGLMAWLGSRGRMASFAPRLGLTAMLVFLVVMWRPYAPPEHELRRISPPVKPHRPLQDHRWRDRHVDPPQFSLLSQTPTNRENFHKRWYLLDNWVKATEKRGHADPQLRADVIHTRITFYRDEGQALRQLDELYVRAARMQASEKPPARPY